ncbi:MAG: long-chain fatty acid--CoA ligase [Candidatus Bathyarchaeota archaeon]
MIKPWLKLWPQGVPFSINYPVMPLFTFLSNSACKYPNRTALIFYGNHINYASLGREASKFANALRHLGVKKGDRVALMLPNVPQFIIAYYGALMAGSIVVALNPLSDEAEIKRELMDCGAETVIVLDRFLPKAETASSETHVKRILVARGEAYLPRPLKLLSNLRGRKHAISRFPRFEMLVKKYPPLEEEVEIDPLEDLAAIQYTGGTAGVPKGVMLTHYNFVANAIQTYHWPRGWGYSHIPQASGFPIVLAAVPLFHIYGMTVAMNEAIHSGSTIVLLPQPEAGVMIKAVEQYKVTHLPATPSMYRAILEHPDLTRRNLSSLAFCVSGGDPIDAETVERFTKATGARFFEGYGLTEASPVTHCTFLDMRALKKRSIGIPFPDTEARIADAQTGEEELPVVEEGELVLRGPQVMKGYLGMPEETERTLRWGWLHTGDIATMNEDGFFHIIDRKQDRIIARGHTIWPTKIEEVLLQHPAVEAAAAVGTANPMRCTTDLRALVVLKDRTRRRVEPQELMSFCRERLEEYQVPETIEIVEALPKTALGKVTRRIVRQRLEEQTP